MSIPYSQCLQVVVLNLSRALIRHGGKWLVFTTKLLGVEKISITSYHAGAISQVGWGQFCTMLKYKAEEEGKVYLEVDRFFPSSKTCHGCLNQVSSLTLDG